ncbi:MAG: nucleotidyltransferase family protein [Myxococcota bacterium]
MNEHERLGELIANDRWRMGVLRMVSDLGLPEGFVTGDFVRHLVWDHLHNRPMTPLSSVDVIYFDPTRTDEVIDINLVQELSMRSPKKTWSVENAARWSPAPPSIEAAIRQGPETASAVAVAVDDRDQLTIIDPFGLDDLFAGIIRPVEVARATDVEARIQKKRWLKLYPQLKVEK